MAERKSAIISGGGSGIGKAIGHALYDVGFGLTITGRRADVLEAAAAEIGWPGGPEVVTHPADVGTAQSCDDIVQSHVQKFGGLSALVTAAAVYDTIPFLELDASSWDATVNVALRGAVLVAINAARHMKAAGGGRIVLLSSINGFHSEPESAHYSAAKAAINSVVRSMAVDLAGTGVIANAIAPGWVYTPMTAEFIDQTTAEHMRRVNPLGRPGRPEEIANLARYLVTEAPEFLMGTTIYIDGGQTALAPMP